MDLTARLTDHLQFPQQGAVDGDAILDPSPAARAAQIAAGLAALGRDVLAQVPSCLTVAILLPHAAGDIVVDVSLAAGDPVVVLASMAMPLAAVGGALLVLQAGEAGAFLLLADDLQFADGLSSGHQGGRGASLDTHLTELTDGSGAALTAALADQRSVEQAVGALLERGVLPDIAREQLRRTAAEQGLSLGQAARQVLAAQRPAEPAN